VAAPFSIIMPHGKFVFELKSKFGEKFFIERNHSL